ncbi:Adenylate kinase 8 [Myotis davidii]|uniref:Adenylate kinase 8 n=1 Tax=Myotis davidii TaxID=225400 RepID=L5MGF9_MYODS|nr:Adenylate kinase 8 [Myotis davidii]
MDATTGPHRIPPEMPQYGERHHVFEMMQSLLEQLLIHQPTDPLQFMIEHLHRNNDCGEGSGSRRLVPVPAVPEFGAQHTHLHPVDLQVLVFRQLPLETNLLTLDSLLAMDHSELAQGARRHYERKRSVPSVLLVRLVQERLLEDDCISRGWILDGIPETREQAMMIQTLGITPRHVKIYHTTFDWPPEPEIQNRLVVPEGISERETVQRLLQHHRNIVRVLPSYPGVLKVISADQPCVDVFYQGERGRARPRPRARTVSASSSSLTCERP